jgi:hypothetical protein
VTPVKKSAGPRAGTKTAATKLVKPPKSTLYEVRRSKIQGRGAFAIKPIRKGQRVDEYWGQRITHEEADRRYDDNQGRHHTFLFVLDDYTVLDARYGGNDARFINHSCDPNCETVIENGHIYIKAIKAIQPETELAYDYRFEWQDEYEPEDIRYYACRCGTKKCRGTILRVPVYLRPTVKEWLAGNDVKKPRKPTKAALAKKAAKKAAKNAAKKAAKEVKLATHPHVAERHATRTLRK